MKPFSAIKVFTRKYEQRTLGNVNKLMDTCFNIGATKTIDLKIRENLHILENNSKKKRQRRKKKSIRLTVDLLLPRKTPKRSCFTTKILP